jgi:hypothetical protein
MSSQFAIHHHTDPPAYYDINIDRGDRVVVFRIVQFDMLALLDGTEVSAEMIDQAGVEPTPLGEPISCGQGTVRLFDAGSCAIERWSPPVYILQLAGRQFYGTFHILKAKEGYSLRYVRIRAQRTPAR